MSEHRLQNEMGPKHIKICDGESGEENTQTGRKPIGADRCVWDEASSRTWSRVSRTSSIDSAAPKTA
jgi:hypothetical protein